MSKKIIKQLSDIKTSYNDKYISKKIAKELYKILSNIDPTFPWLKYTMKDLIEVYNEEKLDWSIFGAYSGVEFILKQLKEIPNVDKIYKFTDPDEKKDITELKQIKPKDNLVEIEFFGARYDEDNKTHKLKHMEVTIERYPKYYKWITQQNEIKFKEKNNYPVGYFFDPDKIIIKNKKVLLVLMHYLENKTLHKYLKSENGFTKKDLLDQIIKHCETLFEYGWVTHVFYDPVKRRIYIERES